MQGFLDFAGNASIIISARLRQRARHGALDVSAQQQRG
jgi:hypothetical protein